MDSRQIQAVASNNGNVKFPFVQNLENVGKLMIVCDKQCVWSVRFEKGVYRL